jgi:tRNA(fMet)-specific endonuclease VapC
LKFLLDTNICIAAINGKSPRVDTGVLEALEAGGELLVSSVTAFELWYGVEKSERKSANAQRLLSFLAAYVNVLGFEQEDGRIAGEVRAELESLGRRIGEYDLLIAGQALRHKLTLVTSNPKEFGRVKGLVWEDWSKS